MQLAARQAVRDVRAIASLAALHTLRAAIYRSAVLRDRVYSEAADRLRAAPCRGRGFEEDRRLSSGRTPIPPAARLRLTSWL